MKTPVLKVAKRGFDIRTANPKDLTIDSTRNQFKVHMTGQDSVTITETNYSKFVDIEHNLGYQPALKVRVKTPGGRWYPTPYFGDEFAAGFSRIDDNTLRIQVYVWDIFLLPPFGPGFSDFDVKIEYVIYVDPFRDAWST